MTQRQRPVEYVLDEGILAVLKWLEKEGFSMSEIHERLGKNSTFGAVSLQDWNRYQRFKILLEEMQSGRKKVIARITRDGVTMSDRAIQIDAGIVPQTVIAKVTREGIPARDIVDHPYLTDSLIHHADEDDKYLILLLRRKQSDYVLGEEGIKRKN